MAKILIPTALRQFTEQSDAVEVAGATVSDALNALTLRYPSIKKNLFNDQGKLRSFVNVYVNDEDIRYLDKTDTKLAGSETISIVPSIAGGSAVVEEQAPALTNDEIARFSRHLILPGSRHRWAEQIEASESGHDRRRRSGRAARPLSGSRRRRTHRPR